MRVPAPDKKAPSMMQAPMQIEFVTHSSVVFRRDPVHLICDPWLVGTAFDNGWALLSEPKFSAEDFASVTHIWFSHEHPDHFSPRTLAMIPEEFRSRITVLFHSSEDRKIISHCEKLGFAEIRELPTMEWLALAPGFELMCNVWEKSDDSWLLIRTPEGSVLNLNDCQAATPAQCEALRAQTGPVDVLMSQFSVSAWDGNAEDLSRRMKGAEEMLDRAVMQTKALDARHMIPFASFVWFCHEENAYMNEALVDVERIVTRLRNDTNAQPVVLYPGDAWTLGEQIDSSSAVHRYRADIAELASRPTISGERVAMETLTEAADKFTRRLRKDLSTLRLRARLAKMAARQQQLNRPLPNWGARLRAASYLLSLRVRPARIWLTDYAQSVEYSGRDGLRPAQHTQDACDIELASEPLYFAFRFLWGGETLQVNGRFREVYPEGRRALFDYLWIADAMNHAEGAAARPL